MAYVPWTPWKLGAIGVGLVMSTALVSGVVAANWSPTGPDHAAREARIAEIAGKTRPARTVSTRATSGAPVQPTPAVVESCNRQAAVEAPYDRTAELMRSVAASSPASAGSPAPHGINGNRKHDERYRAAYAACLRARGYAG